MSNLITEEILEKKEREIEKLKEEKLKLKIIIARKEYEKLCLYNKVERQNRTIKKYKEIGSENYIHLMNCIFKLKELNIFYDKEKEEFIEKNVRGKISHKNS